MSCRQNMLGDCQVLLETGVKECAGDCIIDLRSSRLACRLLLPQQPGTKRLAKNNKGAEIRALGAGCLRIRLGWRGRKPRVQADVFAQVRPLVSLQAFTLARAALKVALGRITASSLATSGW